MWDNATITMLLEGTRDTLYMTLVSTFFGYVLGLPLGILLAVTDKEGIHPNSAVYKVLDVIVNILRSIPFLILLILVIPLTRLLVGKTYGSTATIVPLVIAAAPFVARMVESSLKEVDPGVIEAAVSMGAGTRTIIWKVLLAESRTSLLVGVTIAVGTILGYSAMAGTVGGGGLGDIAIRYGYYRYQTDIMIVTIVILVVLVQILQGLAKTLVKYQDPQSGTWYQVTDQGAREGNYLESSATALFVYTLAKAINKGYIGNEYIEPTRKAFDGMVNTFTRLEEDGSYTITNCCAVAGLGGDSKRYRDGSFEYYIGEPVIENDPKSVGSFILAAIEFENLTAKSN